MFATRRGCEKACAGAHLHRRGVVGGLALGHTCTEEGLWEGLRWGALAQRRVCESACAGACLQGGGVERGLALGHTCTTAEGLWEGLQVN